MSSPTHMQAENTLASETESSRKQNIDYLKQLIVNWRRQYVQQQLVIFLPIALVLFISVNFILLTINIESTETTVIVSLCAFCVAILTKYIATRQSKNYASITLKNLTVHLNSEFAELEESAQLLFLMPAELSTLEKLQQDKVIVRLTNILQQQAQVKDSNLSPKFNKRTFFYTNTALFLALLMLLITHHFQLLELESSVTKSAKSKLQVKKLNNEGEQTKTLIKMLSKQVVITPPRYSLVEGEAATLVSKSLDISTLEGAQANWVFNFSSQSADYFMVLSNGENHPLLKQDNGTHQLQLLLTTSMAYHLVAKAKEWQTAEPISAIHRISLTPDYAPKIRFINPQSTVTEYGINTIPTLKAEVQITDDFAITSVQIMASIAKGSGEGVKFRDQTFTFDHEAIINGKRHYYKNWSIKELAMEPGDELYFSVVATDNHEPEHQQTRSTTKIIRWLEEEQSGINADGILIDFMPEYFKSQRQIIIETIALIEDSKELERKSFNEKSEMLGVAQSALKEKYGQYLGDEFEGQQSDVATIDENHQALEEHKPKIHTHDEQAGSANAVITAKQDHQLGDLAEHAHDSRSANFNANSNYASGRMAMINRYGHNHEDSDVGVMTSEDPRALMKKSLANMWQAELHLMLSEPELALPFEQQALKLLNLARKAERIYVKRLGFEPPPVTEQRRYQGELKDILVKTEQISHFKPEQISNQTQLVFRQFAQLLNEYSQTVISAVPLSGEVSKTEVKSKTISNNNTFDKANEVSPVDLLSANQVELAELTKSGLEKLIAARPALVELLVVIEHILIERRLQLSNCNDCIKLLAGKLEQLLPEPISSPNSQSQRFYDQHPLVESYSQFLEDNL